MLKVILSFSDFQNEVLLIFRNKRLVWIFQIQNKLSSVNFLCKCISVNITFLIVFYVGTDAVDSIARNIPSYDAAAAILAWTFRFSHCF